MAPPRRLLLVVDTHEWSFGILSHWLAPYLPCQTRIVDEAESERMTAGEFAAFDTVVGVSWWWWAKLVKRLGVQPGQRHFPVLADEFSWGKTPLFAETMGSAAGFIAKTQPILAQFLTAFPAAWGRTHYTPNCVDADAFARSRPAREAPVVGWCGSTRLYAAIKGVPLIREAAAMLGLPLIIQDGAQVRLKPAEMPGWYAGIDVFVCASESESGPLPVLEAVAAGLPVVTTNVGMVPALVEAGLTLTVVDRNAGAIAHGIEHALATFTPETAARNRELLRTRWVPPVGARMLWAAVGGASDVAVCTNTASFGGGPAVSVAIAQALQGAGRGVTMLADTTGMGFKATPTEQARLSDFGLVIVNLSSAAARQVKALPETTRVIGILHTECDWTRRYAANFGDLRRVDRWWIVDPALRPWLEAQGVEPERIKALPLASGPAFRPCDEEERADARKTLGLASEDRAMLYCGRLSPEKQLGTLLEVLAQLPEAWRLIVAGGPDKAAPFAGDAQAQQTALQAQAKALGIAGRVQWLGAHSTGLDRLYWACDVVVLASKFEGLPVSLLEAEACGVPWVAPPVGGIPSLTGGVCVPRAGDRYEGAEVAALAQAIQDAPKAPQAPRNSRAWIDASRAIATQARAISGDPAPMAKAPPPAPLKPPAPRPLAKPAPSGPRILFIQGAAIPTMMGATLACAGLVRSLKEAGIYTYVVTPCNAPDGIPKRDQAGTTYEYSCGPPKWAAVAKAIRATHVVVQGQTASQAINIMAPLGLPTWAYVHSVTPLQNMAANGTLAKLDGLLLCSQALADEAGPLPVRSLILYPSVDRARAALPTIAPRDAVVLVNCNPQKGGDFLPALASRLPGLRFIGVRGAYGLQVMLPGANRDYIAQPARIGEALARARMVIVPSQSETFGMIGVEAHSQGIPVLATDCPGLRESLGDAGTFLPARDADAWAEAVQAAWDAPGDGSAERANAERIEAARTAQVAEFIAAIRA